MLGELLTRNKTMTVYKVRDPKTGLFQKGGSGAGGAARWSKIGKVWNTIGHLKAHFTMLREYAHYPTNPSHTWKHGADPIDPNWEIVEFVVATSAGSTYTVGAFEAVQAHKKGKKR